MHGVFAICKPEGASSILKEIVRLYGKAKYLTCLRVAALYAGSTPNHRGLTDISAPIKAAMIAAYQSPTLKKCVQVIRCRLQPFQIMGPAS